MARHRPRISHSPDIQRGNTQRRCMRLTRKTRSRSCTRRSPGQRRGLRSPMPAPSKCLLPEVSRHPVHSPERV